MNSYYRNACMDLYFQIRHNCEPLRARVSAHKRTSVHMKGFMLNWSHLLFYSLYPEDIQVWLTAHNSFHPTDNLLPNDSVLRRSVIEIIMHPNYNRRTQVSTK